MANRRTELQYFLLDKFGLKRCCSNLDWKDLSERDWATIQQMVLEHRIGPWLYWRKKNEPEWQWTEGFENFCHQQFQYWTYRNLETLGTLEKVTKLFEENGIQAIVLKGPYLAKNCYPHIALRPLRDLDLLVKPEQALAAHELLLKNGFKPAPNSKADPKLVNAEDNHQLPVLISKAGKTAVEIHLKPFHGEHHVVEKRFWADKKYYAELNTWVSASTELQLLHLIIHAVLDHKFDNGPLIETDIYFLLKKQSIDWGLFWSLADQLRAKRACVLTFNLLDHHFDSFNQASVDNLHRETSLSIAPLLLRMIAQRKDVYLAKRITERRYNSDKVKEIFSAVFPSQIKMNSLYGLRPNTLGMVLFYLLRPLIILPRVRTLLRNIGRHRQEIRAEIDLLIEVEEYLQ